jgi:hypothetical protein
VTKVSRNVDSSAGPRTAQPGQHVRAGIGSPLPIAANDRDPAAATTAIPTASSPTRGCRRPRDVPRDNDPAELR